MQPVEMRYRFLDNPLLEKKAQRGKERVNLAPRTKRAVAGTTVLHEANASVWLHESDRWLTEIILGALAWRFGLYILLIHFFSF
jgi:hypothetical protein